MTTKFKVAKEEYSITINWYNAVHTLPEKFNLEITELLVDDDSTNNTLRRLLVDDKAIIYMMWHYMEDSASMSFEDFLQVVKTSEVNAFREAFWAEVANFSGPLKENLLYQVWKDSKKYLKKEALDSSASESLQGESTQEN